MDEFGAEVFTTLLPSGTPLPARRQHVLGGQGTLSSVSIDVYQRSVPQPPEKLTKVLKCVLPSHLMTLLLLDGLLLFILGAVITIHLLSMTTEEQKRVN